MKSNFFDFIQYQKRYSTHTIIAYKNDINSLESFLDKEFDTNLPDAEFDMMRSWMASMIEEGLNNNSIHRKISAARSFYNYLIKNNVIKQNPVQGLSLPKKEKNLPVFLTESQTDHFINDIKFPDTFTGIRDRLIIEMFYQTGIRLSELVNLKMNDINLIELNIKVLGKRNKERIIPIQKNLMHLINEYLLKRNEISNHNSQHLFLTQKGNSIYPKLVYRVTNKYIEEVSTVTKKSPHILRHTFATHMLNNGADIYAIKELLGHTSLSATQIYTHNTIDKIKSIYKQAHPRA